MHLFWGKVVHGDRRGKKLGFPTANMRYHHQADDGVYISLAKVGDEWHEALTFIGAAKTFGNTQRRAETWILDFNRNLYGQWISVRLLKYTRGNKKFVSVDALIDAIRNDEKQARRYFKQHPYGRT